MTVALALVCGVAFVSGLVPEVEYAVTVLVVAALVPVVVGLLLGWVVRRVRWYREDREDERAVARLRACARAVDAGSDREDRGEPVRAA